LNVAKARVDIAYGDSAGALYAVQTLRQLTTQNKVLGYRIEDKPRFSWRGWHLDVSRHFFTVAEVKRSLDQMARYKLNRFHWHLVDDGGWRIALDRYPELTKRGAFRKEEPWSYSKINLTGDTSAYGGFYSKQDIRDVVAYAADRGITVVPEIEMPGHTLPSIHAFPALGCREARKYPENSWTTNVYCAGKEQTFQFLEDVLNEVFELFPSQWIHIGGDEVDKKWWRECEDCQTRIIDEKLKDEDELQSYFIRRIEKVINSNGRAMIGWDEILEGGLAPNATVMSWRGIEGGVAAAKAGHEVVMTPTSHCYFDYPYSATSTEQVYGWNPVPAGLTAKEAEKILGGQANVWTEWIPDVRKYDLMVWPRILAMSEVMWSSGPKNYSAFSKRLDASYPLLEQMGVNYYLEEPVVETSFIFSKVPTIFTSSQFARQVFVQTDPKAPAAQWAQLISQEIPANKGFYLAYKRRDGSLGDIAELYRSDKIQPVPSVAGQPGLKVSFWEGTFKSCAEFDELTPKGSGVASQVSLVARPRPNDYGLRFTGKIRFPGRKFKLYLTADDGAVLRLNGVRVLTVGHADGTASVGIDVADGLYDFDLRYFEAGGGSSLKLEIEGSGLKRQLVPESWFSR
jgi:hexosaminidase